MSGEESESSSYDILIVGAGPSAMGLVYGLLLPYSREANPDDDPLFHVEPPFSIAVVERGEASTTALHQSIRTRDPKRWGCAAFASSSSSVFYTAPQRGLHNRIVGVPVGVGVGGGSNVNAGLVCQPHRDDFESILSSENGASTKEDDKKQRPRLWTADILLTAAKKLEGDMDLHGALTRHRNWLSNSGIQSDVRRRGTCHSSSSSFETLSTPFHSSDSCVDGVAVTSDSDMTLLVRTFKNRPPVRTNYFEALVQPLLEANPHLNACVSFLNPMFVERVLFSQSSTALDGQFYTATGVECSYYRGSDGTKQYRRLDARTCVVICAGAILSPALLLASGIGEPCALEHVGITPLSTRKEADTTRPYCSLEIPNTQRERDSESWKGVGKGLNDHIILPRFLITHPNSWTSKGSVNKTLSVLGKNTGTADQKPFVSSTPLCPERDCIDNNIVHSSINGVQGWVTVDFTGNGSTTTFKQNKNRCLIKVFDGSATPWLLPQMVFSTLHRPYLPVLIVAHVLKIILQAVCSLYPVQYLIQRYTKLVAICLMSPRSMGSVTLLTRCNKGQKPSCRNMNRLSEYDLSVDPAYLQDKQDFETLQMAWKYSHSLVLQRNSIEMVPGPYKYFFSNNKTGDQWLRSFASDFANPYFHWSGSLRMKQQYSHNLEADPNKRPDDDYVCEDDLRVRNTSNLYVSCASVFPNPISVPTTLTCAALGFAFANIVVCKQVSTISPMTKTKID